MKYLLIGALVLLILQIEITMLMILDTYNLRLWHAQMELNQSLINYCTP